MNIIHSAEQLVTPLSNNELLVIQNAAVAYENDRIIFVGTTDEGLSSFPNAERTNVSGKVLLPGFVDSHTHLIFGGDRSEEFFMRLQGATYQQIAEAGGGIQSTVRTTRSASSQQLFDSARKHLEKMLEYGTTTVEVKSGYGLDWENERKLLAVAERLKKSSPVELAVTFLGAHDFPREKSRQSYIKELLEVMLPEVAREHLAEFCDVFCDQGYYTVDEARSIGQRASELGLKVKLHVDELADINGAALAAEMKAISADHLIFANEDGIKKLSEAKVCAVLLPGTSFSLRMRQHAPARKMIQLGVRVAIATDFNPGTCFCHSMQYVLQLSTLLYGLTPQEAITAATLNAARAVDRESLIGSLEPGKQMDCLLFGIPHYGYLFYNLGVNRLETVIKKGKVTWNKNRNLNLTQIT